MHFRSIVSLLSLPLLLVDVAFGEDAKVTRRELESKRSKKKNIPDITIKDISWISGTWYPCYVGLTGKAKIPISATDFMYMDLQFNIPSPYLLESSFIFKSLGNSDEPFPANIQRFDVIYYETLTCSLVGLGAEECPSGPNINQDTVNAELIFQTTGSFSKTLQDRLILQSTYANYRDKSGNWVPFKSSVNIFTIVECDVSEDLDGFMFCDIVVNNFHNDGTKANLMTSQFLVKDPVDCKYLPE